MGFERFQGRAANALRPISIQTGVIANAAGSVELRAGGTRVICAVSIEEKVPPHALEKGVGWLTSEYGMLPAATHQRVPRESSKGKPSGRTQEIQRLIGRSLRSIVDLKSVAGVTLWVDCDVVEADGGTRTASITGAYVALALALEKLKPKYRWPTVPLLDQLAAVSVGIVGGEVLLDLDYAEDSHAEVDMNLVMTGSGRLVEVQATAEGKTFSNEQFEAMKQSASEGIRQLFAFQKAALEAARNAK